MTANLTTEQADREWRMVLATEPDKRRIRIAINRGLGLPDNASGVAQSHAAHSDHRSPEGQGAAYYAAYQTLGDPPDVTISDERRQIAEWLRAEINRFDVNGFEPNEWAEGVRRVVEKLESGIDLEAERAVVQAKADIAESEWRRRNGAMPR